MPGILRYSTPVPQPALLLAYNRPTVRGRRFWLLMLLIAGVSIWAGRAYVAPRYWQYVEWKQSQRYAARFDAAAALTRDGLWQWNGDKARNLNAVMLMNQLRGGPAQLFGKDVETVLFVRQGVEPTGEQWLTFGVYNDGIFRTRTVTRCSWRTPAGLEYTPYLLASADTVWQPKSIRPLDPHGNQITVQIETAEGFVEELLWTAVGVRSPPDIVGKSYVAELVRPRPKPRGVVPEIP